MHPKLELEVGGFKKKVTIEALIDTGFSGYLCLPLETAKDLGLELTGEEKYELANGQWITQFNFRGYVVFLGKRMDVEIVVGTSEMPQVGVMLLADCRLTIDFAANKVGLTRKKM